MKVAIKGIRDAGNVDRERIVLTAMDSADIGRFALFCSKTSKSGELPLSGDQIAYWFPDKELKPGDLVILYTKSGRMTEKQNKDGTTSHFFYWRREEDIWKERVQAVLLDIRDWKAKFPDTPIVHEEEQEPTS